MTEIMTIGKYIIESEKVNHVLPNWSDVSVLSGLIIGGIIGMFSLTILFHPSHIVDNRTFYQFVEGMILFLVAILIAFVGVEFPYRYKKCGISVTLKQSDIDGILLRRTFQITEGSAGSDALKIKEIVKEYENIVNELIEKEQREKDLVASKEKECCDAYRKVIEKVKE